MEFNKRLKIACPILFFKVSCITKVLCNFVKTVVVVYLVLSSDMAGSFRAHALVAMSNDLTLLHNIVICKDYSEPYNKLPENHRGNSWSGRYVYDFVLGIMIAILSSK